MSLFRRQAVMRAAVQQCEVKEGPFFMSRVIAGATRTALIVIALAAGSPTAEAGPAALDARMPSPAPDDNRLLKVLGGDGMPRPVERTFSGESDCVFKVLTPSGQGCRSCGSAPFAIEFQDHQAFKRVPTSAALDRIFSSIAATDHGAADGPAAREINRDRRVLTHAPSWEVWDISRDRQDYTPLVVEAESADAAAQVPLSEPLLIPTPAPVWSGLAGLLGTATIMLFGQRVRRRSAGRRWLYW